MKSKREFTYTDMKEAFKEGHRLEGHNMAFQRMMRTAFPNRYVRKKKKAAK